MECESKDHLWYFTLLAEMSRDLKMWRKVESPCYQGSGSCAPGIILVNFAGADEQWPLAMVSFWWECKDGESLRVTPVFELGMILWHDDWGYGREKKFPGIHLLGTWLGRPDVYEAQTISKTKTIRSMCFIHSVGTHQNALPLESA